MKDTMRACGELLALSWRQDPRKLTISIVLKLGEASALPLAASALGRLTDAAVDGDVGRASLAGAVVAVLVIAALTMGHFAHVLYYELGELNFLTKDRELIDIANASRGIEHHERPEYADRVQVLRQELERVGWSSMEALLSGLSLAVAMLVTGVLLARLDPWLLLLPLAAAAPVVLGRKAETGLAAGREAAAESSRRAWHLFSVVCDAEPAKELRVSGLGAELGARHAVLWQDASRILRRAEVRAALLRVCGQLVFAAAYVASTLVVVRAAVSGQRSVGDVVLVISLAALVNQQVTSAVGVLQDLQRVARTLSDFRWMRGLVASPPDVPADAPVPTRLTDGIRLRDLAFRYPGTDRVVLEDVNLDLPAGSTVAIVGENGAGKTTLVKLLCRFYEPTSGTVEVDGVDLRRIPVDAWRARLSAGFQDFARFELVARESVGVGDLPRADSDEAVMAALERAHSADIVDRLEDGLDTQLGITYTDGTRLSGGQWQKIALGRAMMREEPLLLVLDEPTAALDAEAEHLLFEQYAANARRVARATGAITVLVSHRFSTVRMADLILVVSDGRVQEAGDHDALMANGQLYAELYGMQAAAYR
ncbi:ABC transporter ATP-binding protein [Cellulomonas wangsupingiae]|uniref:ABC transporter ATP-binding protein/permease n=1 Tax=Cellulomonas wangsupingiae TaxID=2968085 RepID=A0ABY5K8G9_9CELL|nr:ABC transporter ATP-binding protein [Cellulomonas wangsupingiae]MCC2333035.1 ABC transporter ATP-binding protein/permease [Cellulomonas wangsupingiae]MCM0640393.1 ABC transporter ATP-binding protein/permease [Cellulomonas wangsupingiae]UUI66751.1 ABC transporter ATP-binding protein/permease [Cellulomonas wangsupingiae]